MMDEGARPDDNLGEVRGMREIKEAFITFQGILIPRTKQDYERLVYLCYKFREAVKYATAKLHKNINITYKDLKSFVPNAWYCLDAMKIAKLFSKAKRRPRIKKLFIMSTGNKYKKGNQNIKIDLESNNVKVRDPFNKAWLNFTLKIDQRIKKYNFDHYSVRIVFSEGKIRIYIIVPFKQNTFVDGEFVAGFDFNVDRVNMVIVDKLGIIRDIRNVHFHRVTSPGFPKNKAKDIRLKALAKLLDYARDHNCGIVVFENLKFKNKTKTKSKAANRKIHNFACK